ncbi:unnamed protein product [Nesidiocoris tenuis]|uniref:Deacetylase sirtuin-type domain-containing protein n=2 Tax=Nesidiocoris tenuis TaxID=355587 RepID=A0A6H5GXA0_9HEMI|nr:Hypothetical protein NTJ_02701 [Nesidiocoris tenuis]CAB0009187.1 unnamed protein product [Nesidiocoris tenuis]CAB0009190.1 unnamed protein product [Nesidiocoris tenuis]
MLPSTWCCRAIHNSSVYRHVLRNVVPPCQPLNETDAHRLAEFLSASSKLLVVTGAGISTESGLPDYRSEGVGAYARNKNFTPVQYQTFVKSASFRRRYWLRNYLGWENLYSLKPNRAHLTLTQLEEEDKLIHLITQNVDRLHHKANTKNVIELHGTSFRVICLQCPFEIDRGRFQVSLADQNRDIAVKQFELNPDGDVDISEEDCSRFTVPDCPDCGGMLKPDIVFFGENVPRLRVQAVNELIDQCDALVVCGSSLAVQSSFRIVTKINELQKPIALVNIGKTRADHLISLKVEAKCGDVLPAAHDILHGRNVQISR